MIEKMKIQGFRCFQNFEMHDMKPITLIGGENNAGKSAVMEAILLISTVNDPKYFSLLAKLRNGNENVSVQSDHVWLPLFYHFTKTKEIAIDITRNMEGESSFRLAKGGKPSEGLLDGLPTMQFGIMEKEYLPWLGMEYRSGSIEKKGRFVIVPAYGPYSVVSQNMIQFGADDRQSNVPVPLERMLFYKAGNSLSSATVAEWVSKSCMSATRKQQLLQMLQNFDAEIADVMTVIDDGTPYVYILRGNSEYIPLRYMGDGINKAIRLLLGIMNVGVGTFMIDEIENGFYYDYYHDILSALYQSALQMNCQLLITTHNRDILQISVEVMKELEQQDKLSYQRMEHRDEVIKSYAFDGFDLEHAFAAGMEVR